MFKGNLTSRGWRECGEETANHSQVTGSTSELSNVLGFSFSKSPELILGGKIKER